MANHSLERATRALQLHRLGVAVCFIATAPLLYIASQNMDLEWALALAGAFVCFALWALLRGLSLHEDVDIARNDS